MATTNGYHRKTSRYGERGMVIEEAFYDVDGKLRPQQRFFRKGRIRRQAEWTRIRFGESFAYPAGGRGKKR